MNNPINLQQNDPQAIVTARVVPNRVGGECLKFNINLGLFQLKCIVTIPEDGCEEAPVYIKWKIRPPSSDDGARPARKGNRTPDSGPDVSYNNRNRAA